jgi:hypothetical protein
LRTVSRSQVPVLFGSISTAKVDLPGIRELTVLGDVEEFITESKPDQYVNLVSALDSIPSEDELVSQRIETGQTIGGTCLGDDGGFRGIWISQSPCRITGCARPAQREYGDRLLGSINLHKGLSPSSQCSTLAQKETRLT